MMDFNIGGGLGSADPAPRTWSIALDGGTTNTRARLLCGDVVVGTARRAVGVRDAAIADRRTGSSTPNAADREPRRDALRRAVREVVAEVRLEWQRLAEGDPPARLVAAGMLSSEVGLITVPHVEAPAGLDELARSSVPVHLSEIHDRPILVVPGIRTPPADGPDGWLDADVMRGEECETLGALRTLLADGRTAPGRALAFLWPGSHTKLVEVDADGRIARSFTTLAGEILEAVGHHTILAASLPAGWPEQPDPDAVAAGARAVARHGLGRGAFLVRIAALSGAL
ncbi:MAG: 2-dehydro-3-deoxygalactonokinase, partial [Isosphaeraceae bacterium]